MEVSRKKCTSCGEEKSIGEFGMRSQFRKNDGTQLRASFCKKCMVKRSYDWQTRNKKRYLEYMRNYRKNHKTKEHGTA